MKTSPIAVISSDVHYSLSTLEVADKAMRMAVNHANDLKVPLIVSGDLHDSKANLRAECVNAILATLSRCSHCPRVLVGNHDKINEKSEDNALDFLLSMASVIARPNHDEELGVHFIPYQHNKNELLQTLATLDPSIPIIMHQGVKGKPSGDYIVDHTALTVDELAGRRIISGHYHTRQQFILPEDGLMDFIGNPYTLTYAEASDPAKGYQILKADYSLEFVPTNLRKHVVISTTAESLLKEYPRTPKFFSDSDLIWLKIEGTRAELSQLTKDYIAKQMLIEQPFRLDLTPSDAQRQLEAQPNLTGGSLLDSLIDRLGNTDEEAKTRLKRLWRTLT